MTRNFRTPYPVRCRLLAFVVVAAVALRLNATDIRTLVLRSADDSDTISFDPAKLSEARVRELILLSPFVVDYINDMPTKNFSAAGAMVGSTPDKQLIALPLELCISGDPAYSNCEHNNFGSPTFPRNAQANLDKSKRGLSWLEHLDHPAELNSVVRFLGESLSWSIWIQEKRLKYHLTWDSRALKEVREGIDPGQSCGDTFTKLDAAQTNQQRYEIVKADWANCMVRAVDQKLGHYPLKEWASFLNAYAISEEYKQKGPD